VPAAPITIDLLIGEPLNFRTKIKLNIEPRAGASIVARKAI
jgi:hypothetical protein